MIDQTLAHYEIVEKIGAGGMGDVYLAEDTKLDRKIALKVLPPELADDKDRRARFQREAKAIAALNHPNIVTVHSVEEAEGTHFITMELVKGKTLADVIPKKGMTLDKFFELAIPLADAVASAHEAGIIHRDLKPTNAMVTAEGRVKVLDFGLARQDAPLELSRDSESPTEVKTQEGVIAGTLHYMSPEQVEGKSVDARTDVFSLGVLYYELLTGNGPFGGDSAASVISSILKDTPEPVTALAPSLPHDVARIVRRCLVKDRTRRFQSARDVVNELRELEEEVASGRLKVPPSGNTGRLRLPLWASVGILGVGVAAGYAVGKFTEATPSGSNFGNPVQIASAVGVEGNPAWSPDGGQLAYHSEQDGDFDIWIVPAGGGRPLNLTADYDGADQSPAWAPDGSRIAFRSSRDGGGYFVMPALGGPARRVCPAAAALPDLVGETEQLQWSRAPIWSSDGTELACLIVDETGVSVEIDSLDTRNARRVRLPSSSGFGMDLSWSPNGRFFAFVDALPGPDVTRLWVVSSASGKGAQATDGLFNERSPRWSANGEMLYYVSNRGGAMDLWQQRLAADGTRVGEPTQLTTGIGMTEAVYSPDRTKLAYTRGRIVGNVWRLPILDERPATWADGEQITFERARVQFMEMSPDGRHLLMSSDRSGNMDIWMLPMDGGELVQLTTHPTPDWAPSWSPDGTELVFYSYRSGNRDIWTMPVAGGPARQLTESEAFDGTPSWSPRGDQIAFATSRSGSPEVWVMRPDGSEQRRIGAGLLTSWTSDGDGLVLPHADRSLWIHPIDGSTSQPLADDLANPLVVWSRDGKTMFYSGTNERAGNIWSRSTIDDTVRQVTDLVGRSGNLNPPSRTTDGDYLYFSWGETLGDIWVMDVVQ